MQAVFHHKLSWQWQTYESFLKIMEKMTGDFYTESFYAQL